MWTKTKAGICNGQNHMQNYRVLKVRSIMEAVIWVCDDALDELLWVSGLPSHVKYGKKLKSIGKTLRSGFCMCVM